MILLVRWFLGFILIFSFSFFALGFAADDPHAGLFQNELREIKARMTMIEKQQQDILSKDEEILRKLDQLRIWVHRA